MSLKKKRNVKRQRRNVMRRNLSMKADNQILKTRNHGERVASSIIERDSSLLSSLTPRIQMQKRKESNRKLVLL